MIHKLKSLVPERSHFGTDDEIRDAGIEERGAVAGQCYFVANEDVGNS